MTTARSSPRSTLAWFALAQLVLGMVLGWTPVSVNNPATLTPTSVSCGSAWALDVDDVPERLWPVCAATTNARGQQAAGLILGMTVALTGAFLVPAHTRRKTAR